MFRIRRREFIAGWAPLGSWRLLAGRCMASNSHARDVVRAGAGRGAKGSAAAGSLAWQPLQRGFVQDAR
jgi:hypothetical protein